MNNKRLELDSRLQHPRVPSSIGGEPVATPIYQTSTFVLPTPEIGAEVAAAYHPPRYYTRYGSPNVAEVEAIAADLEGAEAAVAVGSGMAAIAGAILSQVKAGDHVVAQNTHYTAVLSLLCDWLPRHGVTVTQVDQTDPSAFASAINERTRLIYTETPTNPTMELTDLVAVAALAKSRGIVTVTDSTFASSFNQQPHVHGIDLVVHSATKYFNGHHDVTAGVATGTMVKVAQVWEWARVHGPVLHPMEAWLLARGLKTYALRMRQHNSSALAVARALVAAPGIAAVHYPGLQQHPQHDLARRQMTGGFGGMLSFELNGATPGDQFKRAQDMLRRVKLCTSAVSLGGTDTLITHPASLIFAHQSEEELARAGVAPGLLRVSIGLEAPEDIVADILGQSS
ncbi:MAG: aminotransferase class I/II-fold pyridoxal phosphate-dependent enzyme [Hyphomicrobiaceae bacterium]